MDSSFGLAVLWNVSSHQTRDRRRSLLKSKRIYAMLPWNPANNSTLINVAFQNLSNHNCDIIILQIMGMFTALHLSPTLSLTLSYFFLFSNCLLCKLCRRRTQLKYTVHRTLKYKQPSSSAWIWNNFLRWPVFKKVILKLTHLIAIWWCR